MWVIFIFDRISFSFSSSICVIPEGTPVVMSSSWWVVLPYFLYTGNFFMDVFVDFMVLDDNNVTFLKYSLALFRNTVKLLKNSMFLSWLFSLWPKESSLNSEQNFLLCLCNILIMYLMPFVLQGILCLSKTQSFVSSILVVVFALLFPWGDSSSFWFFLMHLVICTQFKLENLLPISGPSSLKS